MTKAIGLGVFDGLHRGHQELLKTCDTLITFDPHPAIVLGKTKKISRLSTLKELEFLIQTVESGNPKTQSKKSLATIPFTKELAQLSPEEFLDQIITTFSPHSITVGYDYHFGHKKAGNIDTLKKWATPKNITVIEIPALTDETNTPIKSSPIRTLIAEGQFNTAISLLGHPYLMMGTVIKGEGRGRKLGIPTANIKVDTDKLIPNPGVFRGAALTQSGHLIKAGIYIGSKPTFDTQAQSIEAHLINFEDNLYDQPLTLFLEEKLRDEQKFNSKEDLITQIHKDLAQIS